MNEMLQNFARTYLKEGLSKCTKGQQDGFNRMYSHEDPSASIDVVVDRMQEDRLSWAMEQVERSFSKNETKEQSKETLKSKDTLSDSVGEYRRKNFPQVAEASEPSKDGGDKEDLISCAMRLEGLTYTQAEKIDSTNDLLHELLDMCYGERRDCGQMAEELMKENGVVIDETYDFNYRNPIKLNH